MTPAQLCSRISLAALSAAVLLGCDPLPECHDDGDCEAPEVCNDEGQCTPPDLFADGVACERDNQCGSGNCQDMAAGKVCTRVCGGDADCGGDTACALWTHPRAPDMGVFRYCQVKAAGALGPGEICAADADCASHLCHGFLCAELCQSCSNGRACVDTDVVYEGQDTSVGVCSWGNAGPDLELGPFETPVEGSREISIEVPAGQASMTVALFDDDGLRVTARSLKAPDGQVLLDIDDEALDLNPAHDYPGVAVLLIPNTDDPAARLQAGTYRLEVGTFDPDVWDALEPRAGSVEQVLVRFEPEGEQGGLLDLNLHFATATGVHADTAADDAFVRDMRNTMIGYYSSYADLRLGSVSYYEIPHEHAVVETGEELREICATYATSGPHGLALNVFVVADIQFTTGLSGGIPGPPGLFDTLGSGVVIEKYGNGGQTGRLLAHESGHFLGLYHTSETQVPGNDPITDTPECPSGTAVQSCPDFGNLMFPNVDMRGSLSLTAGQVLVLRGNPLLYEERLPKACAETPATYDVTAQRFGTGDSARLEDTFAGSCGGAGAPDRAHLYRLSAEGLASLEIKVRGKGFAPAVYVRTGGCGDAAEELGCAAGEADADVTLTLEQPAPGPYFIVVDGADSAGGDFDLRINEISG